MTVTSASLAPRSTSARQSPSPGVQPQPAEKKQADGFEAELPRRLIKAEQLGLCLELQQLHHMGVPVRDIDASLAFWRGKLGIGDTEMQAKGGTKVTWLEVGPHQFHMFENFILGDKAVRVGADDGHHAGTPTFVFSTTVDAAAVLRSRGVEVVEKEIDFHGKKPAALVRDPNGYWMAIIQDAPGTPSNGALLNAFRGMSVPTKSTELAVEEWGKKLFGLPELELVPGSNPGIDAGLGAKVVFAYDPEETRRFASMQGEPPRDFHFNFVAKPTADLLNNPVNLVDQVRAKLTLLGEKPPESAVQTTTGIGACQLFTYSEACEATVEIIHFTEDTQKDCPVQQFTR
jgi:catechol 2,3-dioxygenase-like lactoylglutathione lyase family enzyme